MASTPEKLTPRPSGFIQSVDRALTILEFFSKEKPEAGVSDMARELHLNKSTAFGLLCTLERRGYVEQNPENGKYRLGLRTLDLGNVKLAGFDVARVAHPLLLPILEVPQIDLVHFGIILTTNLAIGMLTPPFGLTLFTASRVLKADLKDTIKETWPFLGAMILVLMIITYVPASVVWIL
jgi:hypothetical protein